MNKFKRYQVAALLLFGVACAESRLGPTPPPSTAVTQAIVALSTPYADDGALVITVKGPDLSTFAAAASSYSLFARTTSAQEARIIIVGDIANGSLFSMKLSTPHEISAYTVSIEQVAMRSDALRESLSRHTVTLKRASP